MVDETEKQRKTREAREAREQEAAEILALEGGTEGPVDEDSEVSPQETLTESNEGESDHEVVVYGNVEDDPEIILIPSVFEVSEVEGVTARDNSNVLAGETPVSYRGVIQFSPARVGMKKNPETGSPAIDRIEFFFNDPHVFYWLHSRVSRGVPDHTHPDIVRAEAVALDDGSAVIWRDKNPEERA